MSAKTPEEVDDLFVKFMRKGDIEGVLELYDPEISFVNKEGEVILPASCSSFKFLLIM